MASLQSVFYWGVFCFFSVFETTRPYLNNKKVTQIHCEYFPMCFKFKVFGLWSDRNLNFFYLTEFIIV